MKKKTKLLLANLAAFIVLVLAAIFQLLILRSIDLLGYLSAWLIFILLSLVVYYISIIADAVSAKNKKYINAKNRADTKTDSKDKNSN